MRLRGTTRPPGSHCITRPIRNANMDDPSEVITQAETFDHSRARVLAALLEAHHTTFYTVISVIQAACFGFLVLVCFEEGTHFGASQWLLAANTLVIMVLVWNGFHQRIRRTLIRAEAG
jgi:uncharacterized membrane protein